MMKKPSPLVIGISSAILFLGVVALIIAMVSANFNGHNWDLGLASQQKPEVLQKVEKSVRGVTETDMRDVAVRNCNTSGTPFGHAICIEVLVDSATLANPYDVSGVQKAVQEAVIGAGVKDSYMVSVGFTERTYLDKDRNEVTTVVESVNDPDFRTEDGTLKFEVK